MVTAPFHWKWSFEKDDEIPLPIGLLLLIQPLNTMHMMGARDGTTFSSFLGIWLFPVEPWSRMNKKGVGWLVQFSTFFGLGLFTRAAPFGWAVLMPFFTWDCSPLITYLDLQNGHQ